MSVGKIPMQGKDAGPSLHDVVARWDHSKLQAAETMNMLTWAGLIAGSTLVAIILITVCKWVVQCKSRGRYRTELQKNIWQYI